VSEEVGENVCVGVWVTELPADGVPVPVPVLEVVPDCVDVLVRLDVLLGV